MAFTDLHLIQEEFDSYTRGIPKFNFKYEGGFSIIRRRDWETSLDTHCVRCGGDIVNRRQDALFCKKECRDEGRRREWDKPLENPCHHCGGKIVQRRLGSVFCSKKCNDKAWHISHLALRNDRRRLARVMAKPAKTCRLCPTPVPLKLWYCGDVCRKKSRRLAANVIQRRWREAQRTKKRATPHFCDLAGCKKPIADWNRRKKFCSKKCANKDWQLRHLQELHLEQRKAA